MIPTNADDLSKLVKRAQIGDASALPAVRKLLEDPAAVDILGGDLARQAEHSLIDAAAGKNLAFREALTRKLQLLREELAGPSPTPIERLPVERVVAAGCSCKTPTPLGSGEEPADHAGGVPSAADGSCAPSLPVGAEDAGAGPQAGRPRPPAEHREAASQCRRHLPSRGRE